MPDSYKTLREEAFEANLEIPLRGLAIYTWGNVSALDSARGVFAIKPSGVEYDRLSAAMMVVVDLEGKVVEGGLSPSSDTETHRVLYREFAGGGLAGITHTHSPYAAGFAQAARPVPVFGTTHADYGAEPVPCTGYMSEEAVKNNYERETGNLIVETFKKQKRNFSDMPMVLVAGHGPFTWGKNAAQSVYHAAILEEICKMALFTLTLAPGAKPLPNHIVRKHWERKHGPGAYYGQK
ncbi:MAG: L-ribulose-5-phosphate 4-epimerase AraD [Treponema sp.]|jgi:L-ribulose-5-phosphate 4-epimerase|nr:L-ribulose-5-phosphate 4-epimerase AraD [Treponema sp.]